MRQIVISAGLGIVAGILDILPMIARHLDRMFVISAFVFWVICGVLMSQAQFVSRGWLNGIIVALLVFAPLSFLIWRLDPAALPVVVTTTVVLGALLGYGISRSI